MNDSMIYVVKSLHVPIAAFLTYDDAWDFIKLKVDKTGHDYTCDCPDGNSFGAIHNLGRQLEDHKERQLEAYETS